MFPEGFIKRIKTQEYLDPDGLMNALQEPSTVSLRINPSKWNKIPLNSLPVPWCKTGYYLHQRPSFTLDPLFHSGSYYPQEASGMFIEQVFKQVVNTNGYLKILDLCGAPGGKSTLLSSLLGNKGFLVANEIIKARAYVLAENLSKWGNPNTIVTQSDPSAFSYLSGYFDLILIDAPCSGEGMFRDKIAIREWSENKTYHCAVRQRRILKDVWPALKQNGILIYSTCTFNPGENEENIKWLVSENMAESLELDITEFNDITKVDKLGINGYGFYPGRLKGEGLFISVIRKSMDDTYRDVKGSIKNNKGHLFNVPDIKVAEEWTKFDDGNMLKLGEDVYHFPGKYEDFHYLEHHLNIIRPGTKIYSIKKNVTIPAHELALSNGINMDAFPRRELDLMEALLYLRHEDISQQNLQKGWFIITYKSTNLGFCKNIGSRINNYYPVEWRIRMVIPPIEGIYIIDWIEN
jgi:16S rRNA C967 or C1407 C5-methylase (RsmB/RsmF family)/NOL1/NOP2/fmu family ribosome biogenesis protein